MGQWKKQNIGIIGDGAPALLAAMKMVREKEFDTLSTNNTGLTTEQKIEKVRQYPHRKLIDLLGHIEQSSHPYEASVILTACQCLRNQKMV